MSTDSRVGYSTSDAGCATVGASAAAISLRILPDAVCTSVVIVATVQLEQPLPLSSGRRLDSTGNVTFVANHTLPVVYTEYMTLSFSGYPDVGTNRDLNVTTLGRVPCLSDLTPPLLPPSMPPPAPPPGMPLPDDETFFDEIATDYFSNMNIVAGVTVGGVSP